MAIPSHVGNVIPPACSGSAPGSPTSWKCLKHLQRETARRHPNQMSCISLMPNALLRNTHVFLSVFIIYIKIYILQIKFVSLSSRTAFSHLLCVCGSYYCKYVEVNMLKDWHQY